MDTGEKLKEARIKAEFIQEQVAEKLQVCRQTVSSLGNNHSYPDILNVLIMSEMYQISLDQLLKGANY